MLRTALTRKVELGFTDAEAAIDDVIESTEPWDVLLPVTRLEMIRKMKMKTFEPEERIQEANDESCPLYVVRSGTVELVAPVTHSRLRFTSLSGTPGCSPAPTSKPVRRSCTKCLWLACAYAQSPPAV